MQKSTVFYVAGFLLLLNLWLLYTNMERQNQIEHLKAQIQSQSLETEQSSKIWGFEHPGSKPAKLTHSDIQASTEQLSLSVIFTDKGCGYCVDHEVENLNKLYETHKNKIKVFLMSYNESFLRRLHGAKFPYELIDPEKGLFNNDFQFYNPVAIVTDRNDMVQILHIAEKDNEEKSNLFYRQMNSLLQSLKYSKE